MQLVTELKDSLINDDIADLCIDLTEIGIDSVMDDGVLAEVPIGIFIREGCRRVGQ